MMEIRVLMTFVILLPVLLALASILAIYNACIFLMVVCLLVLLLVLTEKLVMMVACVLQMINASEDNVLVRKSPAMMASIAPRTLALQLLVVNIRPMTLFARIQSSAPTMFAQRLDVPSLLATVPRILLKTLPVSPVGLPSA